MRVGLLYGALLQRELATRAATLRMALVVTAGGVCGFLAGGVGSGETVGRPGSLETTLAGYEQLAGFFIGLAAGLRAIAHVHDDQRAAWLTQLVAAGVRRDAYLAQLAGAVLLAAWLDWLLTVGSFAAVHAARAGTAPLVRIGAGLPWSLLWIVAVMGLAAACALMLDERGRARFAFGALVLAPYPLAFFSGLLNADRPAPAALVRVVTMLAPLWPAPSLASASYLLLYAGVTAALALLLAPWRIERAR